MSYVDFRIVTMKDLNFTIFVICILENWRKQKKTEENRRNYNKQRNYSATLWRKVEKEYYGSLDEKQVTDNKTFWNTVKHFLSDKTINSPKITLVEKDEIMNNEEKIAKSFNTFLTNIGTSKVNVLIKTLILREELIQ